LLRESAKIKAFVVVQPVKWFDIRLWNFVGLAFQTCPFQCLRIARTAEHHFLAPNQNYDVANLGRCMASDENLWGSELLSHLRTSRGCDGGHIKARAE
jgi:hypothetical protein